MIASVDGGIDAQALTRAGLTNVHHVPDVFVRGVWVGTKP